MSLRPFASCSTNSVEVTKLCWGKSLQASCRRKFSVGSVARSRFARKPSQIWCCLPVPTSEQVKESGIVPTMQSLFQEWLKREEMNDANNLVTCEKCQKKTCAVKWSEITRPPPHLCLCLHRFNFDTQTFDFTKEKTPVKIDEGLWIGDYEYELYHTIIHTGKDADSGHYYAMGRRSEPAPGGDCAFYTMDDSQIKETDVSLLAGNPPKKLFYDNSYVLFLRCKQAPPTPEFRLPLPLVEYVKKHDKKQWVEPKRVWRVSVFHSLHLVLSLVRLLGTWHIWHSLEKCIDLLSSTEKCFFRREETASKSLG